MVSGVIDDVLEHLPHRLGLRHAGPGGVGNDSRHIFGVQATNVNEEVAFDFSPAGTDSNEIREIRAGRILVGWTTVPAFEPKPFDEHEVNERVADRRKAAAEVLNELFVG